ncbi:MAG: sodium:solute symporter [Candidatus Berkiella sp.]
MSTFSWVSFLLLIIFMMIFGIFQSKQVSTVSLYLLAGRKTKLFALVSTLVMTEFNTATLISFSSAGLYAHWWALTLPLVFLIGLLFYALIAAKKWKNYNGVSVTDFFTQRYDENLGKVAGVILFLAMSGFSATYIKSLTLIFSPLFPQLNQWILSAFLVFFALLMTWRGGLIAIIRTDMVSFIIILLFFPILLYYSWQLPSESMVDALNLQQMQQSLPPKFVGSLIFLTMFSYIMAPWYGQKIVSAHSPSVAMKAVIIAAFLIFILYSLGVLATWQLSKKGIALSHPEQALPYLIQHALPFGLQGLGYGTLFITTATTLSGVWSAMVTLVIPNSDLQSERNKLYLGIGLTSGCGLLTYFLANVFVDEIFSKMILANIPIVALSFTLLAGFYWKKVTKIGAYISIMFGLAWGFGCYFYYGEKNLYTWYWAIYGIPLIFISGVIGSLLSNKRPKNSINIYPKILFNK